MQEDLDEFKTGKPVEKEIVDLHQFFEDWFCGNLVRDSERFSSVMANDFELITPDGTVFPRDKIIELIEAGYNTQNDRKIWVENINTRQVGDLIIATYNELQSYEGKNTNRISTAVFSFDPNLPNKCKWHQVHETWV